MPSCSADDMNQYTQIDTNGNDFTPEYDADGNQTLIQTETGIWRVTYNVQNRAVRFENESSGTVITCDYDYLGRRVFKKVEKDGVVTAHERYLYRDYLQIASLDMMEGQNQALINAYVWDPTQPVATRPLVIIYKGVAYYYGWDLTKNITEIFSLSARLQIDYVYTPFGQVRENGIIPQSIQWSSEYHDAETGLVYYNYRYYNPRDGRWTRRDPVKGGGNVNLYLYVRNSATVLSDFAGHIENGVNFWDSYAIALNQFIRWLIGNQPKVTQFYAEKGDPEALEVKSGPIGRALESFFKEKNKDAHKCKDWMAVTDFSYKLLGWKSLRNEMFEQHVARTLLSFGNGIDAFIGSADGKVDVQIREHDGREWIYAKYQVHNDTTTASFFYHLSDYVIEEGLMGKWTQYYFWEEWIPCEC